MSTAHGLRFVELPLIFFYYVNLPSNIEKNDGDTQLQEKRFLDNVRKYEVGHEK